jgi:hypothetical protein
MFGKQLLFQIVCLSLLLLFRFKIAILTNNTFAKKIFENVR